MPYSNVPKDKWDEMDRCVMDVMERQKLPKERAIAICHASIVGGKKKKKIDMPSAITFNINLDDYWKTRNESIDELADEVYEIGEEELKGEGGETENMANDEFMKQMDPKMKACMAGHMKEGKSMKEAYAMCQKEMKGKVEKQDDPQDAPVEEGQGGEATAEGADGGDQAAADGGADDSAASDGGEEAGGDAGESAPADVEQATQVSDLLKQVIDKIDKVQKSIAKQDDGDGDGNGDDSASAEGAASTESDSAGEAAPEGGEGETPAEEGAQDAPPEGAEEVAKSLDKVADSMAKLAETVGDVSKKVNSIDERLTKIEEQPAPSKISSPVVVSKTGNDESSTDPRITEIEKELAELEEMKKSNLDRYQREKKYEKAFDLIEERDQILASRS